MVKRLTDWPLVSLRCNYQEPSLTNCDQSRVILTYYSTNFDRDFVKSVINKHYAFMHSCRREQRIKFEAIGLNNVDNNIFSLF